MSIVKEERRGFMINFIGNGLYIVCEGKNGKIFLKYFVLENIKWWVVLVNDI